jgi:F-type H+-transporting ATPase subunit beta
VLTLSRDIYQQGRLPAVNLLTSTSLALQPAIAGEKHYSTYMQAKQLLERALGVERLVALVGFEELSPDDQVTYNRAQILKNYMTQSFFSAASQTDRPGQSVPLKVVVDDVARILEGQTDKINPDELLMIADLRTHFGNNLSK